MAGEIPKEQIRTELKRMVDQARDTIRNEFAKANAEIRSAPSSEISDGFLEKWDKILAAKKAETDATFAQFHRFINDA